MTSAMMTLEPVDEVLATKPLTEGHPTPRAILNWAAGVQFESHAAPVLVTPDHITFSPSFFGDLAGVFASPQWRRDDRSDGAPTRLNIELCPRRSGLSALIGLAGWADERRRASIAASMADRRGQLQTTVTRCMIPRRPGTDPLELTIAIAYASTELPGWALAMRLSDAN